MADAAVSGVLSSPDITASRREIEMSKSQVQFMEDKSSYVFAMFFDLN